MDHPGAVLRVGHHLCPHAHRPRWPLGPGEGDPGLDPALLNDKYGLDEPVIVQYLNWVGPLHFEDGNVSCCGGILAGDLGPSYKYIDRSVNDIIGDGILVTMQLGVMAFLLSVAIGLPLGIIAALGHNKAPDYTATFISVIGISTPTSCRPSCSSSSSA